MSSPCFVYFYSFSFTLLSSSLLLILFSPFPSPSSLGFSSLFLPSSLISLCFCSPYLSFFLHSFALLLFHFLFIPILMTPLIFVPSCPPSISYFPPPFSLYCPPHPPPPPPPSCFSPSLPFSLSLLISFIVSSVRQLGGRCRMWREKWSKRVNTQRLPDWVYCPFISLRGDEDFIM